MDTFDQVDQAVHEVLAVHPSQVQRWLRREPGAWGFLAGQGVMAYRRRLGRKLTDMERRHLWAALWRALEALCSA